MPLWVETGFNRYAPWYAPWYAPVYAKLYAPWYAPRYAPGYAIGYAQGYAPGYAPVEMITGNEQVFDVRLSLLGCVQCPMFDAR